MSFAPCVLCGVNDAELVPRGEVYALVCSSCATEFSVTLRKFGQVDVTEVPGDRLERCQMT